MCKCDRWIIPTIRGGFFKCHNVIKMKIYLGKVGLSFAHFHNEINVSGAFLK